MWFAENISWRQFRRSLGGFSAIVCKDGSTVWAEDASGKTIASGEAGVDDASVIQSALDAVGSRGGGKVYLADGTYLNSQPISINYSNMELQGMGWSTILKFKDGIQPEFNILTISSGCSGIVIANLQLDCNKANTTKPSAHIFGAGIRINTASAVIKNVYIHDAHYRCAFSYSGHDVIIQNCKFENADESQLDIDHGCHRWLVADNEISGPDTSNGIGVDGTAEYTTDIIISRNRIKGLNQGIIVAGDAVYNVNIAHNLIRECKVGIRVNKASVEGNSIHKCLNYGIYAEKSSIVANHIFAMLGGNSIYAVNYNLIVGNHIYGGQAPIYVSGNRNSIRWNFFHNPDNYYLRISGDYNVFENNYILEDRKSTALAEDVSAGEDEICVNDIVFVPGEIIGVILDDETEFETQVLEILDSAEYGTANRLLLKDALSYQASAGNAVKSKAYPWNPDVSGANNILRNNFGYTTENSGTATFSGDGTTTQFSIAHGLVSAPTKIQVTPMTADAASDFYVTADDTNIYINYKSAPPSGTDNLKFSWYAEV